MTEDRAIAIEASDETNGSLDCVYGFCLKFEPPGIAGLTLASGEPWEVRSFRFK